MRREIVLIGLALSQALVLVPGPPAQLARAHARPALLATMAAGGVDDDSTLAELRTFVKENGLGVQTAGKGRTKAVILAEVRGLLGAAEQCSPAAAEPAPAPAPAAPAALSQPAEEAAPAEGAAPGPAEGTAPDGFEWGDTY